ncbi:SPX domain [Fragilaria crotonensis]|nr:SPX domain [Fragilaria crotonensis]
MRSFLSFAIVVPVASTGVLLSLLSQVSAMITTQTKIRKGLIQATDAQTPTLLTIQLDVGVSKESHMHIRGLLLELSSPLADYCHPNMPGANGPHPQLSSGVRTLEVIQPGSFITMSGQQQVQTLNGCWEMVWRENAFAGSLICGFDLPQDYLRNDASLPKGQLYMSFPIWTRLGLKEAQASKEVTLRLASKLREQQEFELQKMQATPNPIMKALHYRNAAAASIKRFDMQDLKRIEIVPSNEEVIQLQDDLLLTTKGLVFSKEGSFLQGQHLLLGTAFASGVV